jgi:hypothetical protein
MQLQLCVVVVLLVVIVLLPPVPVACPPQPQTPNSRLFDRLKSELQLEQDMLVPSSK